MSMFDPAKVVIIGPTHRQVKDIVWQNTRESWANARTRGQDLGGEMHSTPRWVKGDNYFAVGFATDSPYNIDGYHSPHLLVIITEAHHVEDSHIEAAERLMPERIVMTGNPFSEAGRFWKAFHEDAAFWRTIHISALDSPNYMARKVVVPGLPTWEYVEGRRQELGEDDPMYRASVLGEFNDSLTDSLIPLSWARDAASPDRQLVPAAPAILGVDVARHGEDRTVVCRRDGPVARIIHRVQGHELSRTAGWIGRYCEDHPEGGTVVIDAVGMGWGVFEMVRDGKPKNWRIQAYQGGERAKQETRYADRNAEMWWVMREKFKGGDIDIGIDGDVKDPRVVDVLVGQLASRNYRIERDRRIRLESKGEMRKRGRRSPDEADALAMTYAVRVGSFASALKS
jgi:hypothetical protein